MLLTKPIFLPLFHCNNYLLLWVRAWHSDTKEIVRYVRSYQQTCKRFSDPKSSYILTTLFSTLQISTETIHKLVVVPMKATNLLMKRVMKTKYSIFLKMSSKIRQKNNKRETVYLMEQV